MTEGPVPGTSAGRRAGEALGLVDAETRFLMATGAMARALGLPLEQLLGRVPGELVAGASLPGGRAADGAVLQRFSVAGQEVWEELRATVLLDAEPPRIVLELHDVSDRHASGRPQDLQGEWSAGVGGHELLLERIERALDGRTVRGSAVALMFVDLDRFGRLNQSMGHVVGDAVLTEVGARLRQFVRTHDTVARWGGDEFVLLLDRLQLISEVPLLADRVAQVLGEPVRHGGREYELSASIGVAVAAPDDPVGAVGLLVRADAAMYRVKTSGGGGWSVFDEELRTLGRRREHLEQLLDRAVAEQRIELHYQPIIDVPSQRIVGAEALLRLRDEDQTLVAPLEFLSFAEETGAIVPVDREVLRLACTACSAWRRDGHDLSVAVNLSARQLSHVEALETVVEEVLRTTGLPSDRLTCEMTEHSLTDTGRRTREGIARLVGAGLDFSVDDFGTGYNSLTYLRLLPVQEIKIDQSFLADPGDPLSRAIVTAISQLARELGMRCVAEGVEGPAQHALLVELGVPFAQGWLYGRAVPFEEFSARLQRSAGPG